MPVIRIDNDVMAELKRLAAVYGLAFKPPNTTLRVALGLNNPTNTKEATNAKPNQG